MKGAALFFLLPATAVAAFPFFSTFTTPKLLIAGPVLAVLLWRSRRHLRFSAPALAFAAYLALCVPAYLSAPSAHDALLHLALDLAGFAAYLVAAGRASCTRPVADAPGAGGAEHYILYFPKSSSSSPSRTSFQVSSAPPSPVLTGPR